MSGDVRPEPRKLACRLRDVRTDRRLHLDLRLEELARHLACALAELRRLEDRLDAVDEVEGQRVEEHVLLLDAERIRRGAAEPVLFDARFQLAPPSAWLFESVAPVRTASGERP